MNYTTRQRFVVVAGTRTGGTFLCACLDSHPPIACWRSEPLHPQSTWMSSFGQYDESVAWKVAYILWERDGYQATGFKVTYEQYKFLTAYRATDELYTVKAIHLMRSVVDSVLSREIAHRRSSDPTYRHHTVGSVPLKPISLTPNDFAQACKVALDARTDMRRQLAHNFNGNVIELWCEYMIGDNGYMQSAKADKVCGFLGVDKVPLYSPTRSVNNRYGRQALVHNWNAVSRTLKACKIPETIDEEMDYVARAV